MFSMFINTLNEKRTVLSLLHCMAAAVGLLGLLSDHPQGPSSLLPDIPARQHDGPQSQSRWRTRPSEVLFESLATVPRQEKDTGPGKREWRGHQEGKSQLVSPPGLRQPR